MRTSKTVNGVEYTYEYLGGQLMHETRGTKTFDYCYDANDQLYAVSYKANSSTNAVTYYFAHNWRGDITSIYDAGGNVVAKYEYDDWGNVLTVTNSNNSEITDPNHIANLNPFRYRSYYYDSESGFYYLMSRYYDPVTHRFVNADGYFQSGNSILDTNMNAYCRNNPVVNSDFNGKETTYSGILYNGKTFYGVPAHQLGGLGDDIKSFWSDDVFNVTIEQDGDELTYNISIDINSIEFAWPSPANFTLEDYKALNEIIALQVYELSDQKLELDYYEKAQLYGETVFHIDGYLAWDFLDGVNKNNYLYKKCNVIDLRIEKGDVTDKRWVINSISERIGNSIYWML